MTLVSKQDDLDGHIQLGLVLAIFGSAGALLGYIGANQDPRLDKVWSPRIFVILFVVTLIAGGPLVLGYFAYLGCVIWKERQYRLRREREEAPERQSRSKPDQ